MKPIPTPVADKLGKLIPRLASDHDGEVAGTARAIERTLRSSGLDLHDLAKKVTAPPPEPRIKVVYCDRPIFDEPPDSYWTPRSYGRWGQTWAGHGHPDPAIFWRPILTRAQGPDGACLSGWERSFLESMSVQFAAKRPPSERQAGCLRGIEAKMNARAAR